MCTALAQPVAFLSFVLRILVVEKEAYSAGKKIPIAVNMFRFILNVGPSPASLLWGKPGALFLPRCQELSPQGNSAALDMRRAGLGS